MISPFSNLPRPIQRALMRLMPGSTLYVPKLSTSRLDHKKASQLLRMHTGAGKSRAEAVRIIAEEFDLSENYVRRLMR